MGGLAGRNPGQAWMDSPIGKKQLADAESKKTNSQNTSVGTLTSGASNTALGGAGTETEEERRLRLSKAGQLTNTSSTGKKTTLG